MKYLIFVFLLINSFFATADSNVWEGQPLPSFKLQNQNGKFLTNSDFAGQWLVLYFYPRDKTPGCTIEAQKFTDDYSKFRKSGIEIVGVSQDDVDSHKDFSDTYEMPFNLLADTEGDLSKAMKVNRWLPLPHSSRQTFVIDPQGVIVQHFEDVEPKTHSRQLLEAIKKLREKKQ